MPRTNSIGFFPASGTDYSYGQEPQIASRLDRLARSLKLHLIGISGHRTPAHSVAVGGFADDPHTRGQASDTPGTESIPEATLRQFGLTRPFPGAGEADHIQLLGATGGTTRPQRQAPSYTLADLWKQAGGNSRLAPIMAAIAMAESGGRVDNVSPQNTDGTYDYGLWQINSSHTQFDRARLISDPVYNARAAVAIERSQGLTAWTTYKSGAYKGYTGSKGQVVQPGRVRPGGSAPGDTSDGMDTIFASYVTETSGGDTGTTENVGLLQHLLPGPLSLLPIPDIPDPLKLFSGPAGAIKDVSSFLKWIAWIFHPRNILRVVEFLTGLTIMGIGIQSMFEVWKGDPDKSAIARTGRAVKRDAGEAISATGPGRAVKARKAVKSGKRYARMQQKTTDASHHERKGRVKEKKRLQEQSNKRTRNPRKNRSKIRDAFGRDSGEDIPF